MRQLLLATLLALLPACASPARPTYDAQLEPSPGWKPPILPERVTVSFVDDASVVESAWFVQGAIDPPLADPQQVGWLAAVLPLDEHGASLGPPLTGDDRMGGANGASFTAYARRRALPAGTARMHLIYELGDASLVAVPIELPAR